MAGSAFRKKSNSPMILGCVRASFCATTSLKKVALSISFRVPPIVSSILISSVLEKPEVNEITLASAKSCKVTVRADRSLA